MSDVTGFGGGPVRPEHAFPRLGDAALMDLREVASANGWHEVTYDIREEQQRRMIDGPETIYRIHDGPRAPFTTRDADRAERASRAGARVTAATR